MTDSIATPGPSNATAPLQIPDEAKILSFNVGHGDCTLIEFWRAGLLSFRCLIDGGRSLEISLLDHLLQNKRRDKGPDIDVLVLSHVDNDHQGGLPALLDAGIRIGEYLGPCLPTFERLAWLFEERVQTAIAKARELEQKLQAQQIPIVYPLEGFSSKYAQGRVTLSVLSPASRLLEKLSTARGGEIANLLMNQPLPLDWLQEPEPDEPNDDNGLVRAAFRRGSSVYPNDLPRLPSAVDIDKSEVRASALNSAEVTEPNFFGNSVLNDTSLVIAIDVHLDGIRRKRILLTGDQENWSYLVARHSGGLGVDVLKAPHHGGRVYLRDRVVGLDALYLWLRPRTVIVSANGRHSLPRIAFRDSIRSVGATLFCPNVRSIEPMTAGTVAKNGKDSCFDAFACSSPKPREFSTIILNAHDERADAYACVQGTLHTAPAPIVVIRQEIASPSEKIVRYTSGELEKNANWLQSELQKRHRAFKDRCPAGPEFFAARVEQQLISWNSILPAARAEGMHHLAVDPAPVFSFARAYRRFWTPSSDRSGREPTFLYRAVTDEILDEARKWVRRVPRMLMYANLAQSQVTNGDRLDILQSIHWEVFDGLLAGLLALPKALIADEVRPSLLPLISEIFTAKACSAYGPDRPSPLEAKNLSVVWLERSGAKSSFPNLEHSDWKQLCGNPYPPPDASRSWLLLGEAAANHILLGNYFAEEKAYQSEPWTSRFGTHYRTQAPFEKRFEAIFWHLMWRGKGKRATNAPLRSPIKAPE